VEIGRALLVVLRRGSLRAAEEVTGHKYQTIGHWLKLAAAHAEALEEALVRDLGLSAVEVDECWAFGPKKAQPVVPGASPEAGDRYGCLIQDHASRFIVAHASGRRDEVLAEAAIRRAYARTAGRPLAWCRDG